MNSVTSYRANRRWMARTLLPGPVLFLVLLLGGCSPEDPFVATRQDTIRLQDVSFLRVIHASSDDIAVTVRLDTVGLFGNAPQRYLYFARPGNEGKYYPVDTAASQISFLNSSGSVVATAPVRFRRGAFYSAYLYGPRDQMRVLLTTDTVAPPDRNSATPSKIKLVNLVPDSPPLSLRFGDASVNPILRDVAYGTSSNYAPSRVIETGTVDLSIIDATSGSVLYTLQKSFVFITAGATYCLVVSGKIRPTGNESFLAVAAFNESAFDTRDSLFGAAPFRYFFAAVRLVNLVPGDSTLDVTFYDANAEFAANDHYRRTLYTGTPGTLDSVHTLGHPGLAGAGYDNFFGEYRVLGYNVNRDLRFRVEYHQPWQPGQPGGSNPYDYRRQDIFAPDTSFLFEESKRYTILAYGPYQQASAPGLGRRTVMMDDTPPPPPGMAQVRLFHGGYGDPVQSQELRIRIAGSSTPIGSRYGIPPPGFASVAVPVGSVVVEIIDAGGTVVHTQTMSDTPLEAGKSYTMFLSRGVGGNDLFLYALSEEFRQSN